MRSGNKVDAGLLKRIARAHELQTIFTRGGRSMSEMAAAAGLSDAYFTRMLRLGFLVLISQCAQKARITSGGRNHPDSCRFGSGSWQAVCPGNRMDRSPVTKAALGG